ncbi:hypothetical protein [Altererythrobacter aquiaggeris]|uniref:hypothetical protein n=1 Tax=Aestuarierythrobacter aquiaggeris TaxID=1898396 RepID=UPI00301AC3FE
MSPGALPASRLVGAKHAQWPIIGVSAVLGVLGLHLWLIFTRAINWDEFFYYAQIEQALRGELASPLQTIHVRLFAWLPFLSGVGVDKIIAARLVMFACELVTSAAIICLALKFVGRSAALIAALAYLSAGFVVENGASFRTDPLAIALLMAALCLLLRARLGVLTIATFGVLVGLAGMVTMKAILILPAFAGIAWLRWDEAHRSPAILIRIAAAAAASGVMFCLLLWAHGAAMPDQITQAVQTKQASGIVTESSRKMFFIGVPQYVGAIGIFALTALPLYIAIITAPLIVIRDGTLKRGEKWALAGLLLPVTSLAFYHNSLPYYYAFMLPPVVAASAVAFSAAIKRFGLVICTFAMVANAAAVTAASGPSRLHAQRDIQRAATEIFPDPVAYFDFPAMLPGFKKANGFMTRWGIEGYLRGNGPSYEQIMARTAVPLLLTNDPQFNPSLLDLVNGGPNARLFRPGDIEVIRTTYRQFWGPYWLAGTELSAGEKTAWQVHVPGQYTVSGGPVKIAGRRVETGAVTVLDRGTVDLENTASTPAALTWGDNLQAPDRSPPARPYWTDF